DLHVKTYFQVPRSIWQPEPGRVHELATLPNDDASTKYQKAVLEIIRGDAMKNLLAADEYAKYRPGLETHFAKLETLIAPGSELKAYHLATALDEMLADKGDEKKGRPNLTEFWSDADPKVQTLRREVQSLREQV